MQRPHTNRPGISATLLRIIGFSLTIAFAGLALADPPMRVARLGYLAGAVSFSPAGENDWVAGTLNRPLVTGDRLWADGGARVELQVGTAVVRLGARTFFTLTNLDDRIVQMNLQDGTLNLRVRRLDRGQVIEIDTPNLAFVIRQPGEYRVTVDNDQDSTEVRTRSGRADAYGKSANYAVASGKAYRFFGVGLDDYDVLTMPRADEFDRWGQTRDRSYDTSVSARYVSRDVIGYQDLDQYGSWGNVQGYGNVWTPSRVAADWAPYRDGHWSWVEPWGWTWVDDQPWGFAVSHYGRWANAAGRWSWIPGPMSARAVYAPALVAFVGGGNFQVTASSGNVGAVGWFPLGPREVYRPAYAVSRDYFTSVNSSNTVINNTTIINNYDNRNATTVTNVVYANRTVPGAVVTVPTAAFVQSQPVARAVLRVPEAVIGNAPVHTLAVVAPVQTSVLGSAPTRARPPQMIEQHVIAQSQPPAATVGFVVRERALTTNPGKPVEAAALAALKPAAPAAHTAPGAAAVGGSAAVPAAVVPGPKVEIVPVGPAAGSAVVAPPPRAPVDRRNRGEQPQRAAPPAAQPQPAPLPAALPTPPPVVRPPLPAPQEAAKPGNKPPEPPGRPVVVPPVQPAPAAAPIAPPPTPAPTPRGDKPREQRDAPVVRPPAPAPQEAAKPGAKPAEPVGRPVATPPAQPAQPTPAATPVAPPVAPAPVRVQPPARAPQPVSPPVAAPVDPNPVQPQRGRPEAPGQAKPQPAPAAPASPAPAAQPAEPARPGNAPPNAGSGNRKPVAAEDKKDDKRGDKQEKDDEEKKRK